MGVDCTTGLLIAESSSCPASRWQDAIAPLVMRPAMTFVNAGANKGFNVAEFIQRYSRPTSPSSSEWHAQLIQYQPDIKFACGICKACSAPLPAVGFNASATIYAIEMLAVNAALLRRMFAHFRVPGAVTHAAVSQHNAHASAPAGEAGREGHQASQKRNVSGADEVRTVTIDAFAHAHGLSTIDFLSIDCEGWDALVIEGSHRMLRERRIHVLEFEYHRVGMWNRSAPRHRTLRRVVEGLHEKGYTCFWQGSDRASNWRGSDRAAPSHGALHELSGPAWCNEYETFGAWSNVVCAHAPEVVAVMRSVGMKG